MAFVLTAGQRHETTAFERLMDQGSVKRAGCARSKVRPRRVIGDKSYSSKEIRRYLRRRGIMDNDPAQNERAQRRAIRPSDLPHAQPHRAVDQPPQAVS